MSYIIRKTSYVIHSIVSPTASVLSAPPANSARQSLSFWDRLFNGELEMHRFSIIVVSLLVVGCLGGLAQWSGTGDSITQLALTVLPTMTVLVMILAVLPVRWIINASFIAIIVDLLVMGINIL